MPDRRRHRGPHPDDAKLFASGQVPGLQTATDELSWLLTRGYALTSSLKLVGDRHRLSARQRTAVSRCASSHHQQQRRLAHQRSPESLTGEELWIDGYNVLTTIEAALSGGVILRGRDGCLRDMASMHGNYRKVAETIPTVELLGNLLSRWNIRSVHWLLDRPVSNSGRLQTMLLQLAGEHGWNWSVDLVPDADPVLIRAPHCITTADSAILDQASEWVSLTEPVICQEIPHAWIVDLSGTDR
jgi:hypothetical protein